MAQQKRKTGTKRSTLVKRRSQNSHRLVEFIRKFGVKVCVTFGLIWLFSFIHFSGGFARLGALIESHIVLASAGMGFRLENLLVEGRENTDPDILKAILNIQKGESVFSINPKIAKTMLEKVSWIEAAQVERHLPNTIYVSLKERKPIALWQRNGRVSLIDQYGVVISDHNLEHFKDLIIVTGEEAPRHTAELIAMLAVESVVGERVEGALYVGGRRWDLKLDDGKTIKLPEYDATLALKRLSDLHSQDFILDKVLIAIDVREKDRISVETAPNAIEYYKAGHSGSSGI